MFLSGVTLAMKFIPVLPFDGTGQRPGTARYGSGWRAFRKKMVQHSRCLSKIYWKTYFSQRPSRNYVKVGIEFFSPLLGSLGVAGFMSIILSWGELVSPELF